MQKGDDIDEWWLARRFRVLVSVCTARRTADEPADEYARHVDSLPNPERFLDSLRGQVYRPARRGFETGVLGGWGGGGAEDAVRNLMLRFALEGISNEISIESYIEFHVNAEDTALGFLIFDVAQAGPSFPITLDRSERTVSVDGSARSFTVYTAGSRAVAVAWIDEVRVVVRCPVCQLVQLSLESVARDELADILSRSRLS